MDSHLKGVIWINELEISIVNDLGRWKSISAMKIWTFLDHISETIHLEIQMDSHWKAVIWMNWKSAVNKRYEI